MGLFKRKQEPVDSYKNTPLEKRMQEAAKIIEEFPDRIPCIVEKAATEKDLAAMDKKKYLVPRDLEFTQFKFVIRKRLKIAPEKAIFVFVDGCIPPTTLTMQQLYSQHKNEDGYLYMVYASESTFGHAFGREMSTGAEFPSVSSEELDL